MLSCLSHVAFGRCFLLLIGVLALLRVLLAISTIIIASPVAILPHHLQRPSCLLRQFHTPSTLETSHQNKRISLSLSIPVAHEPRLA